MAVPDGVQAMQAEMARQCPDALASMNAAAAMAGTIAASIQACGRLVLYGMGGSHHVNRMLEPLYRDAGIACHAVAASEYLMAPLPPFARTALIASQSGESGEIIELLRHPAGAEMRFAITLNPDSTLGRGTQGALIGLGGPEQAFAATRSIVLTMALHGAVLEALGHRQDALRALLARPPMPAIDAVAAAVAGCDAFAFAGRHVMQGLAQSGALGLMELARVPTIGFEGGQFRHGPYEFLRPGLAVVLLRSAGPDRAAIAPIAAACITAGCSTVLLDASGDAPVPGCHHVGLPVASGLAAATGVLLALQRLNIAVATARVGAGAGTPLRTAKVTV